MRAHFVRSVQKLGGEECEVCHCITEPSAGCKLLRSDRLQPRDCGGEQRRGGGKRGCGRRRLWRRPTRRLPQWRRQRASSYTRASGLWQQPQHPQRFREPLRAWHV
jgi:hypothetical protein